MLHLNDLSSIHFLFEVIDSIIRQYLLHTNTFKYRQLELDNEQIK